MKPNYLKLILASIALCLSVTTLKAEEYGCYPPEEVEKFAAIRKVSPQEIMRIDPIFSQSLYESLRIIIPNFSELAPKKFHRIFVFHDESKGETFVGFFRDNQCIIDNGERTLLGMDSFYYNEALDFASEINNL